MTGSVKSFNDWKLTDILTMKPSTSCNAFSPLATEIYKTNSLMPSGGAVICHKDSITQTKVPMGLMVLCKL